MPAIFSEAVLEQAIIDKFIAQDYEYVSGDNLHRELTDVIIEEDMRSFLAAKYASEHITPSEIDSIIRSLRYASSTPVYSANKVMFLRMVEGETFVREDRTAKDFHLTLIDFDADDNKNIVKIVNQMMIKGPNLKVAVDVLELYGRRLPHGVRAEKVIHFLRIILGPSCHELAHRHRNELLLILLSQLHAIRCNLQLEPLRPLGLQDVVELERDRPVQADEHALSGNRRTLAHTGLVMLDEIISDGFQHILVANNGLHVGDGLLAGLNLILIASGSKALLIVFLDGLHLLLVHRRPRRSPVIHQPDGNAVLNGIRHGVLVDNRTEHIHGGIHRRTRETDIGRLGKRRMQELGKAVPLQHRIGLQHQLHIQVVLCPVGLIGDTDDVLAGRQLTEFIGELLHRRQIDTAACSLFQNALQLFSAVHFDNIAVADKALSIQELP